jgi:hypothetical protein
MKKMRHKMRLPRTDAIVDVYVDPKTTVVNRDGSKERPFKTVREMKAFFDRAAKQINEEHEAGLKAKREEAEKREREWIEKRDADRKKEDDERVAHEAERKAKEKELDSKLAQLEVELTSLEKTYIETIHLFELSQLHLMSALTIDERKEKHTEAVVIATQLHHLRMALMARSAEHDVLVAQRGKKSSWESLLGGPMMWAVVAGAALWSYQLFGRGLKEKK